MMCLPLRSCLFHKTEPRTEFARWVGGSHDAAEGRQEVYGNLSGEAHIGLQDVESEEPKDNEDSLLVQKVVNYVRALIADGTLQPGDKLDAEREFAARLQMSRASLRSGVARLAASGIVKIRPGVGTFIANNPPGLEVTRSRFPGVPSDPSNIDPWHWLEASRLVEIALAELAAKNGRRGHFRALEADVAGMFASIDNPYQYLNHDIRFHRTIALASGNPPLAALLETISAKVSKEFPKTTFGCTDLTLHAETHLQLCEAISQRNRAKTRAALRLCIGPRANAAPVVLLH